jgi:RIO kinase 1
MLPDKKPWNREREQVFEGVFGKSTLLALYKLMNDGHFRELYGEFNSGKEACIFAGEDSDGRLIAVKIYRIEASDFQNMLPYLKGDQRFEDVGPSKRAIVFAWTKKEFSNLSKLEAAGVRVPHPIVFLENVLIFELVTDGDSIAPQLKKVASEVKNPEKLFEKIVGYMRKAYRAGLVHADLSEYNVLMSDGEPVIIDCGQGVLLSHPRARDFLVRDCDNVASFFSKKFGIKAEPEAILRKIMGGKK